MLTMLTDVRRVVTLLAPRDRRRWLQLMPLLLLAGATEAIGAAGVFALVASIADPGALMEVPFLGDFLAGLVGDDLHRVGFVAIVAVTLFYLLKSVLLVVTEYSQAVAVTQTASNLSVRLLVGYLRAPYLFHLRRNSSDLTHTTTRLIGDSFGDTVSGLVHIAAETLVLLSILTVLLVASPGVTVISAVVLFAFGAFLVRVMRERSLHLGRRQRELGAGVMRHQAQALSAIDEIQVLDRAEYFADGFASLSAEHASVLARDRFLQSLPRITVETLFICGALAGTGVLLWSGASNVRTVSLLGLFAYAGFRIIPSANRIIMYIHWVRQGRAGVETIHSDLAEVESIATVGGPDVESSWVFSQSVVLREVSAGYSDDRSAIVRGVDLEIRCGSSMAIVGATGSGKSTLVRLLVGLIEPSSGVIEVDGHEMSGRLSAWRRQVGFVPQEVHLVDDTVRRNVAFGIPEEEIDLGRVREALQRAQIEGFVASLPDGLDTLVGDRGVRLSGGERQRVGIARALYHQPRVLILDEATSSLDLRTEAAVLRELRSELVDTTLIGVTHRIPAVRHFDQLVFLRDGAIVGVGTYDELEANVPEFRRVAMLGSAAENPPV